MSDTAKTECPRCGRTVGVEKSSAASFEDIDVRVWHVERKNGRWCPGSGEVLRMSDVAALTKALSPSPVPEVK